MGFFSRLMGSLSRRREPGIPDEDIRSHVLAEYPPPPPEPEFAQREQPPALPEMPGEAGRYPERQPLFPAAESNASDIGESLRMIESQLATLRAQAETINERLKHMEFLLRNRQAARY